MSNESAHKGGLAALAIGALGIVYGDIGTSPLYAVKETFNPAHGIPFNTQTVVGGISAILWSLMIVVSLKYVVLIMRADNRTEGGVMALLALATSAMRKHARGSRSIVLIGLMGVALFYGDAVLTPAISVLSAVEGLEVQTAAFKPYVVPISVVLLVSLFIFQRHGSAAVGALFGPIMVVWFIAIAMLGIHGIRQAPAILQALNPLHGISFVTAYGFRSFVVLGAVLLALTGAEALYADMGHFGKRPIRITWFGLVFPALALNYLGQGGLLMANPEALANPFFMLTPGWALLPMVGLATVATIIASQSTLTGAYSLTRQAIQLGYLPRMTVMQTSGKAIGQIYVPAVNWILLAAVLAAVLGFGSSTNLASAFGLAVTGTMLATTILTFFVIRYQWGYNLALCILATGFFILVDIAFFSSSLVKIAEGGWFPLSIGALILLLMRAWRRGREIMSGKLRKSAIELKPFLESLMGNVPYRPPGTAVYMVANRDFVPRSLLHNLKHNKALHERVVFLTVVIEEIPSVPPDERASIEPLGDGFWRVTMRFGFMDRTDVPAGLQQLASLGLEFNMMETSFFLSRERIRSTPGEGMVQWRGRLFGAMLRNASSPVEDFGLPANRVVELGTQVEI